MDDLEELTHLLADTTLREELPSSYVGKLSTEFDVVVSMEELACTAMAAKNISMAKVVHSTIRKFIHLVNNFYFAMYAEKAPRFTEDELELAKAHALTNIPVECQHDQIMVDQEALDRVSRATSNIMTQAVELVNFLAQEFRHKHKAAKEQCKRAMKGARKIEALLTAITHQLDKEVETQHRFVDKSTLTYSDLTKHERELKNRKRRVR
jgi:hypothetical protein